MFFQAKRTQQLCVGQLERMERADINEQAAGTAHVCKVVVHHKILAELRIAHAHRPHFLKRRARRATAEEKHAQPFEVSQPSGGGVWFHAL